MELSYSVVPSLIALALLVLLLQKSSENTSQANLISKYRKENSRLVVDNEQLEFEMEKLKSEIEQVKSYSDEVEKRYLQCESEKQELLALIEKVAINNASN